MAKFIHFDEAQDAARGAVRIFLQGNPAVEALLITDLSGKMRLALIPQADAPGLNELLARLCGPWWTGEVLQASRLDELTSSFLQDARNDAHTDGDESRLKILQRHRSRTAWFSRPVAPPWQAPNEGPPIVVFYSFKGGLGRSTSLAAFAMQRAQAGESVCVVDLDLDSPGAGRLLSADRQGLTAAWGVVDFFVEHRLAKVNFADYWHRCDRVSAEGTIRIMPAGVLDENYADKLGRVDLEEPPSASESGLWQLLLRTREEFSPDWILLDARTGISEPAGQLLSGIAHLHVLLGSVQEQSWQGLDRVLDRLGKERILAELTQCEVLLVQAMVPPGEAGEVAKDIFAGRAEEAFEERYYAAVEEGTDVGLFWTLDDKQSQDAPHVPVPISYDPRLASFTDISDVADALCGGPHAEVGARISSRFVREGQA